jgi:hypothetical protein
MPPSQPDYYPKRGNRNDDYDMGGTGGNFGLWWPGTAGTPCNTSLLGLGGWPVWILLGLDISFWGTFSNL